MLLYFGIAERRIVTCCSDSAEDVALLSSIHVFLTVPRRNPQFRCKFELISGRKTYFTPLPRTTLHMDGYTTTGFHPSCNYLH